MTRGFARLASAALFVLAMASRGGALAQEEQNPFARIGHIVVIYTENRSFDHVFGLFPGAEGVKSAKVGPQVDVDGSPLPFLPRPPNDDRFPRKLPNAPFQLDRVIAADARTIDPIHDFYVEQEQIDGGKMDRFVEASNAGAFVMGYYDGSKLKQWKLAREFTLADHFFHGAFGGSMVNHFFLICACAPVFPNAPDRFLTKLEASTNRLARAEDSPKSALAGPPRWAKSGKVTPDFHAYGTMAPQIPLTKYDKTDASERLPAQTLETIGDRLTRAGKSWAWYAGGWDDVTKEKLKPYPDDTAAAFQTHHQPFLYFANFAPGTEGRTHLKDASEFFAAIDAGQLPQVSFYKPLGVLNGHPNYSDLAAGDAHLAEVVARLRASPNWPDMLIIVTADENGGFYDHVAPPKIDAFGPGARVPTLIISPFAKKGFVDHTVYDTTSILKTIETKFELTPFTSRDAAAADLRNALAPLR